MPRAPPEHQPCAPCIYVDVCKPCRHAWIMRLHSQTDGLRWPIVPVCEDEAVQVQAESICCASPMCGAQLLLQRVQILVEHLRLPKRSSDLDSLLPEQSGSTALLDTSLAARLWDGSMVGVQHRVRTGTTPTVCAFRPPSMSRSTAKIQPCCQAPAPRCALLVDTPAHSIP